jgi:hypothetical protein
MRDERIQDACRHLAIGILLSFNLRRVGGQQSNTLEKDDLGVSASKFG